MRRWMWTGASLCLATVLLSATLAPAGAQTTTTGGATSATSIPISTTGIGKSPPGAGIGTKAALENPKCNADAVKGFGVFPFVTEASLLAPPPGGPFCVAPAPKNNGGATSPGVTADSFKVVVVLATPAQIAASKVPSTAPKNEATGEPGTVHDAILDAWAAYAHTFEMWGRQAEFVFMDSSGDDETAQRADALTVKADKPFAMIDTTSGGLTTLQTLVAQEKVLVFGSGVSQQDTIDQAPYRWGSTDQQAGAINTAEWAGKQLAKGKAQWAGDDALTTKPRAFGAIYTNSIDIKAFIKEFAKNGGKLASPALEYTTSPGVLGDATLAQQQAPEIVTKLKTAGVTSVFLFSDSAMNTAMTKAATSQEYYPEWLLTGYQYADLSVLSRSNDLDQWAHAFGISNLFPYDREKPATTGAVPQWYWGNGVSTTSQVAGSEASWLAHSIMYAGPNLTPTHVQQGYFATPAMGGAASDMNVTFMAAFGKTAGLPYNEYMTLGVDFAPVWFDSATTGSSQVTNTNGKGVTMYVNDAKRYKAGTWPTKTFNFFDPAGAVSVFDTSPLPPDQPAPCTGCPSQGGAGTPAASAK